MLRKKHGASSAFFTPLPFTHGWDGREKSQGIVAAGALETLASAGTRGMQRGHG